MNRSITLLASSFALVGLTVGCAAPTSSSEGDNSQASSEDLSTASSVRPGAVIDPLCFLDSVWLKEAEQVCAESHKRLIDFKPSNSCEGPGGPVPAASAADGREPSAVAVPIEASTEVSFACCNVGDPSGPPTPASGGAPSTAAE